MRFPELTVVKPKLKEVLSEATPALARLDAKRLEEIALACEELMGDPTQDAVGRFGSAPQDVPRELRVFHRTLLATAANRKVLARVHESSPRLLEYGGSSQSVGYALEGSGGDD